MSTFFSHEGLGAFDEVARCADRGSNHQASLVILGRIRVLSAFLNVLDGDQSLEHVVVINHKKLFDAVLVKYPLSLFQGGADGHSDQVVLRHHVGDRKIQTGFKPQVPIGEYPDESP